MTQSDLSSRQRTAILRLAGQLAADRFPRGDLAALRRLDAEHPSAPAFWKLLLTLDEDLRRSEEQERGWALILHGMALMAPNHHQPTERPGRALQAAGYSEFRLNRLLRARGPAFRDMIPGLCRFLAAKGRPLDWALFGVWILANDDSEFAEGQRRRLARDYFTAAVAAEREEQGA